MFFSRISVKIAVWYSAAFILSALLLFGLTAYLLGTSLQSKDHDLLIEKTQEYSMLYARDGIRGLQLRASSKQIKNAHDFVVRLSDANGKTLFIHSPDRSEDPNAHQLADIDQFLAKHAVRDGWIIIPASDFGDDVEVFSKTLTTGDILQVGKDTEDREEFFKSFAQAYFQGLIPIFLLAILIGGFLSRRLLKPIRWLTQTVENIRLGNPKARVTLHKGKDELWQLGHLFNQMLQQNERLVEGMRETVDNVAHDLRTPVMRLQNSVEGALRGDETIERFKEALVDCKESSDLILKLVDGIMDIAEADAGTLRLKRESLTSVELLEGVVDLYGFVAEEKNIALTVGHSDWFALTGDRMKLLQMISNLVDNAIKYSDEGTSITLESRIQGKFGLIKVIDRGVGIPASELPRIWDRLYRVDTSRSSRGLGLGLSLVKAIVSAHGGSVGAEPNPVGNGTIFFVKFQIT